MDDAMQREQRPRPQEMLRILLGDAETAIYLVVAVLLAVAAAFTIVDTVREVIRGASHRAIGDTGVFILDRILLMFIFAELLYTLRLVSFRGRVLVEPFLFIGLIAVVRKILVLTAESEVRHAQVSDFLLQIAALAGLVLVLALSIHLLRRSAGSQP